MSHVAPQADFHSPTAYSRSSATPPPKNVLRRALDLLILSRQQHAQRDIDRAVSWRDGNFNDSFEREIAERSYSDGWNVHR